MRKFNPNSFIVFAVYGLFPAVLMFLIGLVMILFDSSKLRSDDFVVSIVGPAFLALLIGGLLAIKTKQKT